MSPWQAMSIAAKALAAIRSCAQKFRSCDAGPSLVCAFASPVRLYLAELPVQGAKQLEKLGR